MIDPAASDPAGVLHVCWEYPPVVYGGLARHVEHLARAQHAAGLPVTVVTAAEDVTDPARRVPGTTAVRRGIRVHRARRPNPRLPWSDLIGAADQLGRAMGAAAVEEVLAHRPAVVHAHDWTAVSAARAAAAAAGVPFVLTVHATEHGRHHGNLGPQNGPAPAAIHRLEREAVAAADAVIVCSQAMRTEVIEVLGAPPHRVQVIPNAVDAAAWHSGPAAVHAARRRWLHGPEGPASTGVAATGAPQAGEVLLAAAGRIEWEKGFSTLVRALPGLQRAGGQVRLVLAGRGSDLPRIEALAAELGVGDLLELPGWLASRDLAALFAAADVVVVPSRYEPSGLVAREAQAAGATVIVTSVGGLGEAVQDGETGLVIGVGDVHGLRDAVLGLVTDPARARRLGAAAARAAEAWTWERAAEQTSLVYASLQRVPAPVGGAR